jgi:ribosome-associated toxin RatA of RatAB toxin-antitoxin module
VAAAAGVMRTVDRTRMRAPVERVLAAAADVERWPALLPHYRRVRMLERRSDGGLVEMAAWRPFGPFNYPTWWVSEMRVDRAAPAVHYRHVRGITAGMDVVWRLEPAGDDTEVTIVHDWAGPPWPVVGGAAAAWVIGPVFIHGIASRTLAGIRRAVEAGP